MTSIKRMIGAAAALSAGLATTAMSPTTVAVAAEPPAAVSERCIAAAAKEERSHYIPDALLQSLALAESGRRDEATKQLITWPWTVMAEGEGRFYPSKAAAVTAVTQLRAKGVRNIDVGCMQINLMHHAKAFDSIEQAFDPETNVAYGARYLAALRRETGSWFTAVKRYHSALPKHHLAYRSRVFQIWRNTKQQLLANAARSTAPNPDNSEAMSATITFRPLRLADLPMPSAMTMPPQPRGAYWKDAFTKADAALAEFRQRVAEPQATQSQHLRIAAERARTAMQVLSRSSASN